MRNIFKKLILMGVAVTLAGIAEAKTFRYATTGDVLGLDPHANNEGPTNTMKGNLYGRLLHRKADLSLEPDLATKWEKLDATTWRFSLRQGVKFHNGNDFNADDVLFSYKRQTQESSDMSFALATVKEIRKVDD
ncbi:MAG: ABC transporter substrate-binding protein, partial [Deltaproteobacteria bacterium]